MKSLLKSFRVAAEIFSPVLLVSVVLILEMFRPVAVGQAHPDKAGKQFSTSITLLGRHNPGMQFQSEKN